MYDDDDDNDCYGSVAGALTVRSGVSKNLLAAIARIMSLWEGLSDDAWVMHAILDQNNLNGKWRTELDRLQKDYMKSCEDAGQQVRFLTCRDYLAVEDVRDATEAFRKEFDLNDYNWIVSPGGELLGDLLDLTETERRLLDLAILCSEDNLPYGMRQIFDRATIHTKLRDQSKFLGLVLRSPEGEIKAALKGFLVKSGILVSSDDVKSFFKVNDDLSSTFTDNNLSLELIEERLFPSNIVNDLTPEHYPHLCTEIDRMERIVNKTLERKTRGINVLLWGLAGGGKTMLAFALAEKNGWKLKVIGDVSDSESEEKGRAKRLTSLKIAQKLFSREKNVVLLFDEMEDLVKTDNNAAFSKAFINRIVETTTIPVIWTTNSIDYDTALLRRMAFNIHFETPPEEARRKMWEHNAIKHGVEISDEHLDRLARDFDISPAMIGNAVSVVEMSGLPISEADSVIKSLDHLVNGGKKRVFGKANKRIETPYDLSVVNADTDVIRMVERMKKARPSFSLLLYGPPGAGKTALGKHIAEELGKKAIIKRYSDLQSMYVGEGEKLIAKAFAEAREQEAVLIIDEADSFIQERSNLKQSWEITYVNECLSQMEAHCQPFIASTNLMQNIDAAALRRFTFKIKFDYLTSEAAGKLFRSYFGVEPVSDLYRLKNLMPGDFEVVKHRAEILDITDAIELVEMLSSECALKPDSPMQIGF